MKWNNPKDNPIPKDGLEFISFREEFNDMDIVCWEEFDEWEEGCLINKHGYFYHPRYCSWWLALPQAPLSPLHLNESHFYPWEN